MNDAQPTHGGKDTAAATSARSGRVAALLVGAGILLSRIAGLIRERVLATYFGTSLQADVFSAGLRMPNVLQNLLGEGTLSASFIPVYSELLEQGRTREAGRVAGAMFALLVGVAGAISLLGIVLAPLLVTLFTPGFEGQRRELTIAVVRIVFPMTGVLVLSAWALGVLNSHRRFFVPYFAPVLWNAAIIATLIALGSRLDLDALLMAVAWGALAGGVLQFGVQLPWVLRLERGLAARGGFIEPGFREAVRNAGPAILGRGVVQLSTYVDMILASLLAIGALATLRYAQTLYVLPISLFGLGVAAAELPELARQRGGSADALRARTVDAVRRVAFYVVPSFVAFVVLGEVIVAGLYQAGEFGAAEARLVWLTLAAYSLGLLASTSTRIYQSAFFALRDTATPARIAGVRVLVAAVVGAVLMVQLEPVSLGPLSIPGGLLAGLDVAGLPLGPVGLALGAAAGSWVEWALLRRRLDARIGAAAIGGGVLARTAAASLAAAAGGLAVRAALPGLAPLPLAAAVAAVFALIYFPLAQAFGLTEARVFVESVKRRLHRGR